MGDCVLFTFVPPSDTSKATGHTIAKFIADRHPVKLAWTEEHLDALGDIGAILIMSGAAAYCDVREKLAMAMYRARRVVWIQDDYTARPTPVDSPAESPYRAVFRRRHEAGKLPVDYWTTCEENAGSTAASSYVNWNALGYAPITTGTTWHPGYVIYYGGYRPRRRKAFARYFSDPKHHTTISSKPGNEFTKLFPQCHHVPQWKRPDLIPGLACYDVGLYLADEPSCVEGHSPARRFYEMLSAGLAICFDPDTLPGLRRYGIDARAFTDLDFVVECASSVAERQGELWRADHIGRVERQLRIAWRKL